jgi:four helix bundle protein
VWRRAHRFAVAIRRCTRTFPRTGYADLRSQLTRAAESIASNIVEGCGAATPKEFARYLDISIKSTSEAEYQLELAKDYGVLGTQAWARLTREATEIRKMVFGLRRAVLNAADGSRTRAGASEPSADTPTARGHDGQYGPVPEHEREETEDWELNP